MRANATALLAAVLVLAAAPGASGRSGTVDLLTQADVRIDGAADDDRSGGGVAPLGDMNGDGRGDVVVGARDADNNGRAQSGSAYVVFGRPALPALDLGGLANGFRIDGQDAGDNAGETVAPAGDVNGDGRPDVVVGAALAGNNARGGSGSAYVVFGKASDTNVDLDALGAGGFRIDGAQTLDGAGSSVAGLGDVNGDGLSDLAVGAELAGNNGRALSGSVWVVFGKVSITSVDLAALGTGGFRVDGAQADDQAGEAAGPGDVNGDGRADVLVGAFQATQNGRNDSGSAYVVFGKASNTGIDLAALGGQGSRIDGAVAEDHAGVTVAGPGDVNGGGRPDVLVGADRADNNGRNDSGSSFVVFGETLGPSLDLAVLGGGGYRIDGAEAGGLSASSLSGAGDVNADGRADVIVGAPAVSNNGRNQSGSAYVSFGKPSATTVDLLSLGSAGLRIDGAVGDDRIGDVREQVAAAGDFNGDRGQDVIVGSTRADNNGRGDSGSAFLAFGSPPSSPALPNLPPPGVPAPVGGAGTCSNVIRGNRRANRLIGTGRGDRILGGRGNDLLRGRGGGDCLFGGSGRDRLFGDLGRDRINGGPGRDRLSGGQGRDRIEGGTGNDLIYARDRGRDRVACGRGRDRVRADAADRLIGCERRTR